ncbi:exopolysaccharide biosynthesis polyprenyl glycosylphosphotransferase [Sphingobium sp. CAP-1]|uniref:exopolysaccharide biosynthesis polyprenyl glycosylphosphotransferase n=1 Tax=Sphingobium sp. CAP-1 TaxID=2676077 RepID=UPI0018AD2272|nr:exopolysaccharide biosynthesis polyprenyl glycosylphosphotransferase [Sphingobium sp. CAP-1]
MMVLDQICLLLGFGIGEVVRRQAFTGPLGIDIIFLAAPLYLTLCVMSDGYSRSTLESVEYSVSRSFFAIGLTGAVILASMFLLGTSEELSRLNITVSILLSAILLVIQRVVFARTVRSRYPSTESVLIIMDGPLSARAFHSPHHDILDVQARGLQADVGDPMKMHAIGLILAHYDRVIVHCDPERRADWALILKGGNVIGELAQPGLRELGAVSIGHFGGDPTLVIAKGPLSLPARLQKRAFDLAFTIPAILALLPLFILVALAVKLDSPGPVLFKQKRVGRGNTLFDVFKFRSMRQELNDLTGSRSASRDDDRITRVGRVIRRTSIDELPQLFNVLLGNMSLIGPRPHALGSLAGNQLFWDVDRQYWRRHALKPGITGLAQVRGFRGATHEMSDLQKRLAADLEYVSDWTLLRDLRILILTLKVVLHKNAY